MERTIKRYCQFCGNKFRVIPSRLRHGRGKHCSPRCMYATRRAQPRTNQVKCRCLNCNKKFYVYRSSMKNKKGVGKYCCRKCRDQHWLGKNTPNWQGNWPVKYGSNWQRQRRRALRRANYRCEICNCKNNLHVHHDIPARLFSDTRYANKLWNLKVLCAKHHRRIEAKFKWINFSESGELSAIRMSSSGFIWRILQARQASLVEQRLQ